MIPGTQIFTPTTTTRRILLFARVLRQQQYPRRQQELFFSFVLRPNHYQWYHGTPTNFRSSRRNARPPPDLSMFQEPKEQSRTTTNPSSTTTTTTTNTTNQNVVILETKKETKNNKHQSTTKPSKKRKTTKKEKPSATLPKDKGKDNNDDDDDDDYALFGGFFTTDTPQDGWDGLRKGIGNIMKGTAAGAASVIQSPIVGYQQKGMVGLAQGIAFGAVSGVALPVSGVATGIHQVSKGILSSFQNRNKMNNGMIWDTQTNQYIFYNLENELEKYRLLQKQYQSQEEEEKKANRTPKHVQDTQYYDLLQVSTNATNIELKKAYYKTARGCHPDTNPDDPNAIQRFQELSNAYQILSNSKSRELYDKYGPSKNDGSTDNLKVSDLNPTLFFALLFGSESIQPYIGDLWIATKADKLFQQGDVKDTSKTVQELQNDIKQQEQDETTENNKKNSEEYKDYVRKNEKDKLVQTIRQLECGINLKKRIEPYINDTQSEEEFIFSIQLEGEDIVNSTFGDVYCKTIGQILEMEAEIYINSNDRNFSSMFNISKHTIEIHKKQLAIQNHIRVVGAGISAAKASKEASDEVEQFQKEQKLRQGRAIKNNKNKTNEEEDEEELEKQVIQKAESKLIPALLELATALNIQDITKTLQATCKHLFNDNADILSIEQRLKRANAIRILGKEFKAIGIEAEQKIISAEDDDGSSRSTSTEKIKLRAEIALVKTMAEAQGQKVSDKEAEEMIKNAKRMKQAMKNEQHQTKKQK